MKLYYFLCAAVIILCFFGCARNKNKAVNVSQNNSFDIKKIPYQNNLNKKQNTNINKVVLSVCDCLQPITNFKNKYKIAGIDKSNYNAELREVSKSINTCMKDFNNAFKDENKMNKGVILDKIRALCPDAGNMIFPQ